MASRSILLIDDDADDQFVFADALNTVNPAISIELALDGMEALEKLSARETTRPHLIFVDLNMPRMNGKNFLREIKSLPDLNAIPVIIYSTSSNPADIAETKALGATDFITKPNSYDKLCNVLSSALKANLV